MAVNKVNDALSTTKKINLLNDMIIELNGLIAQAKFNINEIDELYTATAESRKYLRNQLLGHTLNTYSGWTDIHDESGYTIWKFSPTTYTYNILNQLYLDNKVLENRGEANSETATIFDKVFLLFSGPCLQL